MSKSISKKKWIQVGLTLLAEKGENYLRIQTLADTLDVTKGSFYHHFKNRHDFVENIFTYWQERNTENLIKISRLEKDTKSQADILLNMAYDISTDEDVALRNLAMHDKRYAKYQKQIDQQRINYLHEMNEKFIKDSEEVKLLSLLDYAIYVGLRLIIPQQDKECFKEMIDIHKKVKNCYMRSKGEIA